MSSKLPDYIRPKKLKWQGIELPFVEIENSVLGIYYNILCPQEKDAEARKKFYLWIGDLNPKQVLPFNGEDFLLFSPATCTTIAIKAFSAKLAQQLLSKIDDESFEVSLEDSLQYLEKEIAPIFKEMSQMFHDRKAIEKGLTLKMRCQMLADAFEFCGKYPRQALDYTIKKYQNVQNNRIQLQSLLLGSINKGSGNKLRPFDWWEHRKKPLITMLENTLSTYPNTPYFLALQEVTPMSLQDLKQGLSKNIQWISFNNTSRKPTEVMTPDNEILLGEANSHTATIALSPELQLQRFDLGTLPACSGSPRTILGVEVHNNKTGKDFAIISAHADYLIQDNLYAKTVKAIKFFIKKFTHNGTLPFIFGGDLNAFEGMKGAEYITKMQNFGPLLQVKDFREGDFYSPCEIQNATFLGHVRDEYKMLFDDAGNVQPNALDHIFLTPEIIFGFRKAGVYDEQGSLINPIGEPEKFRKGLMDRNTTSDHFMQGVLFKL